MKFDRLHFIYFAKPFTVTALWDLLIKSQKFYKVQKCLCKSRQSIIFSKIEQCILGKVKKPLLRNQLNKTGLTSDSVDHEHCNQMLLRAPLKPPTT